MVDQVRRKKLECALLPLTLRSQFSRAEANQICEVDSGFLTRLLNEVVRDGLLESYELRRGLRFRWTVRDPNEAICAWIDRQVNGDQVKCLPAGERPRERLLAHGAVDLCNADLLAILIRVGVRNESATTGARKLANHFRENLASLRLAAPADLKTISPAITKPAYCQIMAGIELGRRLAAEESHTETKLQRITSTAEAVQYCSQRFAHLAVDGVQEEFHVVTLDTRHKPIHSHRITVGILDASLVHPREVFRPAIRDSAAAVLLVHNHPSGDPEPSREDYAVTQRLTEAGKLVGIHVLDHIVVARQRSISLREVAP